MEYPELVPIVLVIVVVGFLLESSSSVARAIVAEQARFRSTKRCFVAIGLIAASYGVLAATTSPTWYFVLGAALSFVAPTLAWFVSRGGPMRWLRIVGMLGFAHPIVFFIGLASRRG